MTVDEKRELVDQYLKKNGKSGTWKEIAKTLGVDDKEYVRDRYRKLDSKGLIPKKENDFLVEEPEESSFKENFVTGEATLVQTVAERIKTLEDLIRICQIDIIIWDIVSYEVNKWEVGRKNKKVNMTWKDGVANGLTFDEGTIYVEPLFQVKAKLSRKRLDKDLGLQKEAVIAELKAFTPYKDHYENFVKFRANSYEFANGKKDCCLEINIPDLHLGKLAWKEETGDDYDIKIAVKRYVDAIHELVGRTNIASIEKIVLVIGHDMLNIDGKNNLTTAGTPQSSDSRFYKIVKVAKHLLIQIIDSLTLIAPVDVVVVPGNHDNNSMLLVGDILEAWYHDHQDVNIFNDAAPRKYYVYGVNLTMHVHGNNEKLADLGIICATEKPQLWAATKYRRVHVGHFHHSKQIKFTDVQEHPGFTIKIINSLSSNDAWHAEKGFLSLKSAEAFLYHKDKGLLANYYHQI